MNEKQTTGKRNLTILNWMGLACQLAGVLLTFAAFADLVDNSPIGGALLLIFGMALSGWASNLLQITDVKGRVSELEGRMSKASGSPG